MGHEAWPAKEVLLCEQPKMVLKVFFRNRQFDDTPQILNTMHLWQKSGDPYRPNRSKKMNTRIFQFLPYMTFGNLEMGAKDSHGSWEYCPLWQKHLGGHHILLFWSLFLKCELGEAGSVPWPYIDGAWSVACQRSVALWTAKNGFESIFPQ